MNIKEISKLTGISSTTISRILNGNTRVNPETTKKVLQIVKKHNYVLKKRKKHKEKNLIAVLVPSFDHAYFNSVLEKIKNKLEELNCPCFFIASYDQKYMIQQLNRVDISGIILLDENIDETLSFPFLEKRIPIVMCGAMSLSNRFSSVHVDDMVAAFDGMNYLLNHGHRHIGIISSQQESIGFAFQRLSGCKQALKNHGIKVNENYLNLGDCAYEHGYQATLTLIHDSPEITGIYAFSDDAAIGAFNAVRDKGLRVPEDISILGFDGIAKESRCCPYISSVYQPLDQIVHHSLTLLFDTSLTVNKPSSIIVEHKIMDNGSIQKIN